MVLVRENARDDNVREDRIGDEAFLMRQMMKFGELLGGWYPVAGEFDDRIERDLRHEEFAVRVLRHDADSLVLIAIDNDAFLARDGEKCQHVAARYGSDESFLGID